ncbi:ceramide kinase isoform X2 [Caretta caretta]|uniref:ceramide kinase isoform X2 n=1 Tax=Caretta caretta TaxID=8467 RepID=UPI003F4BAB11
MATPTPAPSLPAMGDPFHLSLLRIPRGRFRVSLPPGGEFLLGTPEPLSRPGAAGQSFCIPITEMVGVQLGGSGSPPTVEGNQFTVFFVQREKRQRWSLGSLEFTVAPGSGLAPRWVDALQRSIQLHGVTRPRKLLVFVNPVGGRCRAGEIYRDRVAGLFALAGIQTEVIETQRPHEARELILQQDLGDLDGLVCVGGDGTFNELMHALISRTQRKAGIPEDNPAATLLPPRLRIGIIPAGSTDCICFATVGTNDPVTSALHIIIGFKAVLCNRSYEGTVEFLTAGGTEANPRDQTRCRAGCLVCSESSHQLLGGSEEEKLPQQESTGAAVSEWQREQGRFLAINLTCMSSACPKSPDGLSPSAHLADGTADLILVRECSALGFLRHLSRHMDHRDQFDLPFVSVHRVRALRFTPKQLEGSEERERPGCRGWKGLLRGLCWGEQPLSSWSCDGETLPHADISVRVHGQLIHLFARGIEQKMGLV